MEFVFMMRNVPKDPHNLEKYVKGALNMSVKACEYSRFSETTALVTIENDQSKTLDEISQALKRKEDDLVDVDGPLQVIDPGYCPQKMVVENLDDDLMSLGWLKLYIESTFADGYAVISADGYLIQDCQKAAYLTFSEPSVIPTVLENEDHVPFLSEPTYLIKLKPFYSKFHEIEMELKNKVLEKDAPNNVLKKVDTDERYGARHIDTGVRQSRSLQHDTNYPNIVHFGNSALNSNSCKLLVKSKENPFSTHNNQEKQMECQEVVWNAYRGKIQELAKCPVQYLKDKQVLQISGEQKAINDAITAIKFNVLSKLKKVSICLDARESEFLKTRNVSDSIETFCKDKCLYEIGRDSLTIFCDNDAEKIIEALRDRFLHTSEIEIPNTLPDKEMENYKNFCPPDYFVRIDDAQKLFIITGMKESVELISEKMWNTFEIYSCCCDDYTFTGWRAMFINRHGFKKLEDLLSEFKAEIVCEKVRSDEEIFIQIRYEKRHKEQLYSKIKDMKKSILMRTVLEEMDREDQALTSLNLKANKDKLQKFQETNKCSIIVKKGESSLRVKTGASTSVKAMSFANGEKQLTLGASCIIQITASGNILKENTDLFICGLHHTKILDRTAVGKSFSQADSNLQDEVSAYTFSPNGVVVKKRTLPGSNCKALAFIKLEKWNQSNSSSSLKQLQSAIYEVLETAIEMGLRSLSIPDLACGRAFRFPIVETTQAIANTVQSFESLVVGHSLQLIRFVLPKKHVFAELSRSFGILLEGSKDNLDAHIDREYEMEALVKASPQIQIIFQEGDDICLERFKDLKSQWLHEELYQADMRCYDPSKCMNNIIETGVNLGVWVWRDKHAEGRLVCKLKGPREKVLKVRGEIDKLNKQLPLFHRDAPPRNTFAFAQHAGFSKNELPSYWKFKCQAIKGKNYELVDIEQKSETFQMIDNLVLKTWDQGKVGKGMDAVNIQKNSMVKVTKVQRVENPSLFTKYSDYRKGAAYDYCTKNDSLCPLPESIPQSTGPIRTMEHLSEEMKDGLFYEFNECYLFHGTLDTNVKSILNEGIDFRVSSPGMLGTGAYTAESSTKADQYADAKLNRLQNGSDLKMFLVRVTLGDIFLTTQKDCKYSRPPCSSCLLDSCQCSGGIRHNSVMADVPNGLFREFAVYSNNCLYTEYLITYQRV